jgi:hypothetical protein
MRAFEDMIRAPPLGEGPGSRAAGRRGEGLGGPQGGRPVRLENKMKPEIGLNARVIHGDEYLADVSPGERAALAAAMKRLTEMGLKQGHW